MIVTRALTAAAAVQHNLLCVWIGRGERWAGYRELGHQALVESAWVAFDSESIPVSSRLRYGHHRLSITHKSQG